MQIMSVNNYQQNRPQNPHFKAIRIPVESGSKCKFLVDMLNVDAIANFGLSKKGFAELIIQTVFGSKKEQILVNRASKFAEGVQSIPAKRAAEEINRARRLTKTLSQFNNTLNTMEDELNKFLQKLDELKRKTVEVFHSSIPEEEKKIIFEGYKKEVELLKKEGLSKILLLEKMQTTKKHVATLSNNFNM